MGDFDHLIDRLPHKPPALFVDEVFDCVPMQHVRGAVDFPEGHRVFENHLPGEPMVPGVILIEALTQVSGLILASAGEGEGTIRGYLGEVRRIRFRRPVRPGERVSLAARLVQAFGRAAVFEVTASVNDAIVCEGEIVVAVSERGEGSSET